MSVCSNVDDEVNTGFWTVNSHTGGTQAPMAEGQVLMVVGNGDYVAQIAIGCESNKMYHRSKLNRPDVEWNSWVLA